MTRSSTESVEIGMRSVSSSDSGANVFDPRNRSGRNNDPRTALEVSEPVVSTLYASIVTGTFGRFAESGFTMGVTRIAESICVMVLSMVLLV